MNDQDLLAGLVLGPGPRGRCDDHKVGGAVVRRDAGGGWQLLYYCRDHAYPRPVPATLGSGRVALATSQDGVRWQRFEGAQAGGAVLDADPDAAAFDSGHVGLTDLTEGPDGLTMWTFGGRSEEIVATGTPHLGDVPGLRLRCGRAVSTNGIHWRRIAGEGPGGALFDVLPDELYAAWPNALPQADGSVLLHYTAPTHDMHLYRTRIVRLAASGAVERLGALEWSDGPAPYDEGGIVTRHVIADPWNEARWLMAYTALDADHGRSVALARSDDGIRWRHVGAPILHAGPAGHWDDFGVAANRLVPDGDTLRLYYYGFRSLTDSTMPRGIGLAIADGAALDRFRRVAASGEG